MRQITIISGKGGTGKTTLTASFAVLNKKSVIADCDVDAPDLHLLLKPEIKQTDDFVKGLTYNIDCDKCVRCGKCAELCRFNAIDTKRDNFEINEYSCEKCGLCEKICPVGAIYSKEKKSGESYSSETGFGKMVYARLNPGAENSGKLVSIVRQKAEELAKSENQELIIIDGPPGKGCPVIAAIANVDAVVIITEPTVSGISDFSGVAELTKQFKIKTYAVVNKADINLDKTGEILKFCGKNKIEYIGNINYDKSVVDAVNTGTPIVKFTDNEVTNQIKMIWNKIFNA
ncbi:MAG TPA: ATP-binding protein [bacterium]|nr:ATP-binding protein [bacterium]HPN30159.1 ATP-binding protein [bacterium]